MVLRRQFVHTLSKEGGREGEENAPRRSLVSFHCVPTGGFILQIRVISGWAVIRPRRGW
jgi:hypothetical protein